MKKVRYEERRVTKNVPRYSTKTETVMESKIVSKTKPGYKTETYTVPVYENKWVWTPNNMYAGGSNGRWVSTTRNVTKTRRVPTTEHYSETVLVPVQKTVRVFVTTDPE